MIRFSPQGMESLVVQHLVYCQSVGNFPAEYVLGPQGWVQETEAVMTRLEFAGESITFCLP